MIRRMTDADIPAAMRLKEAAGWNQTERDWENLLAIEPDGCWVYEVESPRDPPIVAGSTTAICYGNELAWIGMVLVLPQFRGQGIARRLMEHALRFTEERGVERVALDATDMGRPLYTKLGFADAMPVERWEADIPPSERHNENTGVHSLVEVNRIADLDRLAFGADRGKVIGILARCSSEDRLVTSRGYLLARPGSGAHFLGPCVAEQPAAARRLIQDFLAKSRERRFFWDLLPDNLSAPELARELGFRCARRLMRMSRPPWPLHPPAGHLGWQFATAGFEYG